MAGLNNVSNLRRVLVGFRGHDSFDKPKITDFFTCLVSHFSPNELSTVVNCGLQDDMLLLCTPKESEQEKERFGELGTVELHHSPECPLWKLHENITTPQPIGPSTNRGINVGVAVLLESSDSRVLMTQRSNKMRTFPRAWVPPGGNLEVGETPLQGALREMEEEAGLQLNSSNSITRLLCLWESVYPPLLPLGAPTSHHVVLYFHAKSKESWEELQAKIKLDPEEVQGCTWLSRDNVRSLYESSKDDTQKIEQFVLREGEIEQAELDIQKMFYTEFWRENGKYIYTGSQLALTKWLQCEDETASWNFPCKI